MDELIRELWAYSTYTKQDIHEAGSRGTMH